jgi:hypothetical protein
MQIDGVGPMAELTAEGSGIEVETHPRFHRYWRVVQKLVIGTLALAMIAALFGLMGAGPLSRSHQLSTIGSIAMSHDRFSRVQAAGKIVIEHRRPSLCGPMAVHLDQRLVDALGVMDITPSPLRTEADARGITYIFDMQARAGTRVTFHTKPEVAGVIRGQLTVAGEAYLITQYVWP